MTAHAGEYCEDGSRVTAADVAHAQSMTDLAQGDLIAAVRVVAARSLNLDDCRTLLAMLGADTPMVVAARANRRAP